jgi:hypothetical protein
MLVYDLLLALIMNVHGFYGVLEAIQLKTLN